MNWKKDSGTLLSFFGSSNSLYFRVCFFFLDDHIILFTVLTLLKIIIMLTKTLVLCYTVSVIRITLM